jgi:hypothetical protein
MKFKRTIFLTAVVVTMSLLLGTITAQAVEVIFDVNGNATQILDLPITDEVTNETTVYDVDFVYEPGINVYGSGFDFPGDETILLVRQEVNNTLNAFNAELVGGAASDQYFIGNKWEDGLLVALGGEFISGDWETCERDCIAVFGVGGAALLNPEDFLVYADFTVADGPPPLPGEPVTIGGSVTGLEGSGLVLKNNGIDNLSIAGDGPFTFVTPLTPGGLYSVTVATNPTNPTQTCSVENGGGEVPAENVTDVAVTCAEAVLGDLNKVAAEGDTLPDETVLETILLDGGVAINIDGNVAFGGRDDAGTDAVFTQAGKVAAEGDTLPDNTILAAFRGQGEVAISSGQSGDRVAFHGQAESGPTDTAAVFTQDGLVAKVGDTLSAGITVDDIDPEGKVAINNFDQVAFHGTAEIEGGLFDEQFRVVIISDGEEIREAVREASNLPDGTPLDDITESGGVAINDFDEVAFHGQTVDPEPGGDSLKAVFTSDGLVAKEADILPDGTLLDDIDENGGVAINLFGEVAFHGDAVVPDTGGDSVKAVFTQDGLVAKVGDILPDGTTLEDIEVKGGVAINLFGDVTFHGRTGGVKAVFTQDGLVAKVGDNLSDGTTLDEIWDSGGVAINPYDHQVAFHGKAGAADAVFVGLAPIVVPPAESEEM